ncbi:MAG: hypothetical protein K8R90_07625, partial [Candidatus Cloacimonetes bacterium]|nr:hypothetical protein [Candidatus Cloacimonadota bacterium]
GVSLLKGRGSALEPSPTFCKKLDQKHLTDTEASCVQDNSFCTLELILHRVLKNNNEIANIKKQN